VREAVLLPLPLAATDIQYAAAARFNSASISDMVLFLLWQWRRRRFIKTVWRDLVRHLRPAEIDRPSAAERRTAAREDEHFIIARIVHQFGFADERAGNFVVRDVRATREV
jgi:hypothetical protein